MWDPSLVGGDAEWVNRQAAITATAQRVPRSERPKFTEMSAEDAAMEAYTETCYARADEDLRRVGYAMRDGVRSDPVRYVHPVQGCNPRTAVLLRDDEVKGRRTRSGTRETSIVDSGPVPLVDRTRRTTSKPSRGAKFAKLLSKMAA